MISELQLKHSLRAEICCCLTPMLAVQADSHVCGGPGSTTVYLHPFVLYASITTVDDYTRPTYLYIGSYPKSMPQSVCVHHLPLGCIQPKASYDCVLSVQPCNAKSSGQPCSAKSSRQPCSANKHIPWIQTYIHRPTSSVPSRLVFPWHSHGFNLQTWNCQSFLVYISLTDGPSVLRSPCLAFQVAGLMDLSIIMADLAML